MPNEKSHLIQVAFLNVFLVPPSSVLVAHIVVATIHAVLAHFLDQRGSANSQPLGRTSHHATSIFESLMNKSLLKIAEVFLEIQTLEDRKSTRLNSSH